MDCLAEFVVDQHSAAWLLFFCLNEAEVFHYATLKNIRQITN